jgi:hypothetical protein
MDRPMPKRKRVSYPVIDYGEWTRPRMENFREQCCDCGLIHRVDFRIVDARTGRRPASVFLKGAAALLRAPLGSRPIQQRLSCRGQIPTDGFSSVRKSCRDRGAARR